MTTVAVGSRRKRAVYENDGFKIGENLFTTQEDERGGLDSGPIQETAERILKLRVRLLGFRRGLFVVNEVSWSDGAGTLRKV